MFMHVRRDGNKSTDSLWFYGGLSIDGVTGNRCFDFEMYQTDIVYNVDSSKFLGYGSDEGHTSWEFDASGNVTKPGDIIFAANYQNSSLSSLEARIWVRRSTRLSMTPAAFSWGAAYDGGTNGSTFVYASILPKTAGDFYTGAQSNDTTWVGPFQLVLSNNNLATRYTANQFMEFSVNLTKLGLDPLVSLKDPCALPFRRLMAKTRSSVSFTSAINDFVSPFTFFRAPKADVTTNFPIICNSGGVSNLEVSNPVSTSIYKWKALSGNIVGSTTGTKITVDQPGTYVVQQFLMDSCITNYATDTIQISMTSNCQTLDRMFTTLDVKKENKQAIITWNCDFLPANNFFEVQRSLDGVHFQTIQTIYAKSGGHYRVPDDISQIQSKWIYYRLRYVSTGQSSFYSKSLSLFNKESNLLSLVTAPNPVTDKLRLSLSLEKSTGIEIVLRNDLGAVVYRDQFNGLAGINEWQIVRNGFWKTGMYVLEVKMDDQIMRRRLLLQ